MNGATTRAYAQETGSTHTICSGVHRSSSCKSIFSPMQGSQVTTPAPWISAFFDSRYASGMSCWTMRMSDMPTSISPSASRMDRYMEEFAPFASYRWDASIPASSQERRINAPKVSSPTQLKSFTSAPSRARFSHTLRVTPPADRLMCPGLESRRWMGARDAPLRSAFAAPTPTIYGCLSMKNASSFLVKLYHSELSPKSQG